MAPEGLSRRLAGTAFRLTQRLCKNRTSIRPISCNEALPEAVSSLRRSSQKFLLDQCDQLFIGRIAPFQICGPFFAQLFVTRLVTGPVPMRRTERSAPPMPDPIAGCGQRTELLWI